MSEGPLKSRLGEALGLGTVLPELYHDLLQESAKEVGDSLVVVARAVRMALSPVEATVWGYEQIRGWLSLRLTAKLADTPAENITSPPGYIAGPALLNLHFVADQDALREMYANLLATSMDRGRSSSAHPAYASVIQQLSPEEARILRAIADRDNLELFEESLSSHGFPQKGSDWLFNHWRRWCKSLEPPIGDESDAYLDNLLRLRLLQKESTSEVTYYPEMGDRYGISGPSVEKYDSTSLRVTDFGRQFILSCVLEPGSEDPWS